MNASAEERRRCEASDRAALERLQVAKLNGLLAAVLPANRFYAEKLAGCKLPLASLDELTALPLTLKDELSPADDRLPIPANLTWPIERYARFHQTSGTHGRPLPVYDTADDWQWWIDCWQFVLDAGGVTADDRALLAFSFGPFIGFWSAHDALAARGAMVIPAGGMSTHARLDLLERTAATVLLCTPSYALHLAEVAYERKINLARSSVETIIVAGEPGGSLPSVRQRIESAWGAHLVDHAGASEVGPWGYADAQGRGVHVLECEFIAEFLPLEPQPTGSVGKAASAAGLSHLVLTSLGRTGMPIIRYQTGDLVRPVWPESGANRFVLLEGGVVGRADDMLIVRGVNVFPSAIDQVLRSFPEVVEYRAQVIKRGAMDELVIDVEDRLGAPARIVDEFYLRLGLKVDVRTAEPLSLPRFEGKGKRIVDRRGD